VLRYAFLFLCLFCVACTEPAAKVKVTAPHAFPLPQMLDPGDNFDLVPDHFYVIGWSEDGKLAYVNEPGDEACGCYFMDIYIKDAHNKELYHYHFTNEQKTDEASKNDSLGSVWLQNRKLFNDTLNRYHIIPGNFTVTKGDTARTGRHTLAVTIDTTVVFNKDEGFNTIGVYSLLLQVDNNVTTLYKSSSDEKNSPLLGIFSAAVITEPSGKYAAVLIARNYKGWEGPPNTLRYDVYSCRFK